jgi:hypothetical protein
MSTLDEITKEKQRLSEALARVDAQRENLTSQLTELEATERVLARLRRAVRHCSLDERRCTKHEIISVQMLRPLALDALNFGPAQARLNRADDAHRHIVLQCEDVARSSMRERSTRILSPIRTFSPASTTWWVEPVRHGHFAMGYPFLDLPNVIGSPHNSAGGGAWRDECIRRAVQNCRRAIVGKAPRNLIGPDERML